MVPKDLIKPGIPQPPVDIPFFCLFLSPAGKSLLPEKETQGNYQAEEHSNVTLTCIPPGHDASPPKTLFMALDSMEPLRRIYEYDSRAKAEPYIDNMFKGRLKCQLIETMSIECLLSDLRLNDTGPYRLVLDVDGRRCHNKSTLLVTRKLFFYKTVLYFLYINSLLFK